MGKRVAVWGTVFLLLVVLIAGLKWLNNKNVEATTQVRPAVGYLAPDFTIHAMNGTTVRLESVVKNNRLTLINFWGIWCPYCIKEIPELMQFYDQYAGRKVELLGINVGDDPKTVPGFVLKNKMKFPILFDLNNRVSNLYQVQGFPTTIIVDHQRVIRDLIVGATNYSILAQKVEKLLNGK
jgi:peroxiredoxin